MTDTSLARQQEGRMTQPLGTKDTLEGLLAGSNFQSAVKAVLPDHLKPERILKMGLVAASRQPLLYKCSQASVLQSLMRSAELGLDCSGTLGLGYLVPYWNSKMGDRGGYECQFIPGYRGIIELAKRANNKMQIEARTVFANDHFEFEYGLDPKLVHRPTMGDQGDILYFYCISRQPGLEPEFTVMTRAEVDAIMLRSNAKDRQGNPVGPWRSDYAEMGRKTVTKRHCKYLSLSVEVQQAINLDDEQYRSGHTVAMANEVARSVGVAGVKERLGKREDDIVVDEATPIENDVPQEPASDDISQVLDSDTEDLRAHLQDLFNGLDKSQQKNLLVGRTSLGKMSLAELEAFRPVIEKVIDEQ